MKKIGIIMGGYSNESKISLKSGEVVFNNIDIIKYKPYKIYLFKDKWYVLYKNKEYIINKENFSFKKRNKIINFDIIFNIIHGNPGENGIIQAYFELINQPYTGSDFYTSSLTFNKKNCSNVLKEIGIYIPKSFLLKKKENNINYILNNIEFPCIVKPNKSGSSLGISKVEKKEDILSSIDKAFNEDDEILIENFLYGIEISVTVFNYRGLIKILPITEIISYNNFFDYEAKYLGKSKEITPARITKELEKKILNISINIYKYLNIKGLSRIEFIIVNNIPYFLEINTIPGITNESILPKQAIISNISLKEIINDIIKSVKINT